MQFSPKSFFVRWSAALALLVILSLACSQGEYNLRLTPTIQSPIPTSTDTDPSTPANRPRNLSSPPIVYGLTEIKKDEYFQYLPESKSIWLSSQLPIVWQKVEKVTGQYDWKELDEVIVNHQRAGIDCTAILMPVIIDADQYEKIKRRIGEKDILDFLGMREAADMKLYPHEPVNNKRWRNFVNALVERYDSDGLADAPGLLSAITNWRIMDEYPSVWFSDAKMYVPLVQATYDEIHTNQPQAKVILAGLESDLGRKFAFSDGYIDDDEAGIEDGVLLSRAQVYGDRLLQKYKKDYEYILKEGKGYYDAVDIHIYEPITTFFSGKIDWLRSELSLVGVDVPIWCLECGGPFKLKGGQQSKFGDVYFGKYSDKENAEFVAKMMLLAIAGGMERITFPLVENDGIDYYNGPYSNMGLIHPNGMRKPSYYTFIMVEEFVRGYRSIIDLSSRKMRLFELNFGDRLKYVGWLDAEPKDETMNLVKLLPGSDVLIQPIVSELDTLGRPVIPDALLVSADAVPMNETPLLIYKP